MQTRKHLSVFTETFIGMTELLQPAYNAGIHVLNAPAERPFMSPAKDTVWGMTPDQPMAKQLAIRDIPSLVYDAVNLEGVAMTLPEVLTILDGITVGGHRNQRPEHGSESG